MTWYQDYLESSHWRAVRASKLRQADYRCEVCGERGEFFDGSLWGLHVHHLTYENLRREPLSDLRVLCIPCHRQEHGFIADDEVERSEVRRRTKHRVFARFAVQAGGLDEIDLEVAGWDRLAEEAEQLVGGGDNS